MIDIQGNQQWQPSKPAVTAKLPAMSDSQVNQLWLPSKLASQVINGKKQPSKSAVSDN